MPSRVTIKGLPENSRPRERLLALGVDALSASELLAIVLRSGARGENALELASGLLAEFGGVRGLASMRAEELATRRGMGLSKAAAVVAALRLGRLPDGPERQRLRTARDWAMLAGSHLADLRRERTIVAVLDAGHRVLSIVTLTDGSVDRALLPVRDVLNAVLRHDGRAFAIAHNHPSGDPEPSEADLEATRRLAAAAGMVGLRFLDHVIVAGEQWLSVKDRTGS